LDDSIFLFGASFDEDMNIMGIRSYFKNTAKDNLNVKGWASWDSIKKGGQVVGDLVKDLKAPTSVAAKRNFADVVREYGLSENDLQLRMKSCLRTAAFCAILGLAALCWMIFLLTKGMFFSGVAAFSVGILMFAYAFREHFHYFEIKQRRLDCTVKEWFVSLFSRKK